MWRSRAHELKTTKVAEVAGNNAQALTDTPINYAPLPQPRYPYKTYNVEQTYLESS